MAMLGRYVYFCGVGHSMPSLCVFLVGDSYQTINFLQHLFMFSRIERGHLRLCQPLTQNYPRRVAACLLAR